MYDRRYFRFLILTISAVLLCISLHLSASADSFTVPSGAVSLVGSGYTSADNYFNSELSVGGSVPSGYSLCGVLISPLRAGNGNTYVWYIYTTRDNTFSTSLQSSGSITVTCSGASYSVANSVDSSGNHTYLTQSSSIVGTGNSSNWLFYSYIPTYNPSGELLTPPSYVDIDLNVLLSTHHLLFNTTSSDVSSGFVDYYMFPSSLPLSSYSAVVSSGNTLSLSQNSDMQQTLVEQGFSWFVNKVKSVYNPMADFYGLPPSDVSSSDSFSLNLSLSSGTQSFNPSSFNLPFLSLGSGSFGRTMYIDLKSVSRTGVYAYDNICLLAVYHGEQGYSYARFDFNLGLILSETIVPPSDIHSHISAPSGTVSDLQDLADYLKDLADNSTENNRIGDENFIAMLGAIPWTNFVSGGVSAGLDGWTPRLAMELDDVFGSLFSHWINPSQDDLNDLINDLQEEKQELRSKLAFVTDVKTEVLFVHTSILESGTTPPKFRVPLSVFWSGGSSSDADSVVIIDFESIPAIVITSIKNVLTVFLSLSVVLYIWRTLPATIGNMPNDKE